MIRISAFRSVPPFAQGVVRDLRVRWALEEAGLAYEVRLLGPDDQKSRELSRLQPFGQVPSFEDGELTLFESGAIVLHIAERSDALLPSDRRRALSARTWIFAALNTIEPHIQELAGIDLLLRRQAWTKERRPMVESRWCASGSASSSVTWRGVSIWRIGFTAGDLMMSAVLRILRHTDLLADFPSLAAYRARCEARPAFERAHRRADEAVCETMPAGRGLRSPRCPSVEPDAPRIVVAVRQREIFLRAHLDQARGGALELVRLVAVGREIERGRLRGSAEATSFTALS